MGSLQDHRTGRTIELEAETPVGRSPRNVLHIESRQVSSQHAIVRWTGEAWHVRDLGSQNGTWVDGRRLERGELIALPDQGRICFGSESDSWQLVDAAGPLPMLRPLMGSGAPTVLGEAPVSLPSDERTVASVFWHAGRAILEMGREHRELQDGDTFDVEGIAYRTILPRAVVATHRSERPAARVEQIRLSFRPSLNEEHIGLELSTGVWTRALRPRGHNYLLLLLVRQRLDDRQLGLDTDSEGWVHQDVVCTQLKTDRLELNSYVYRIRKQFSQLEIIDAANIIERRLDSEELRIGVRDVQILG